ncbi:hypothetical protein [Cryptosporangium aurantiacum]|uniref:Uncharacterized protein n=1 Tax=Cryptosporangium aurantiacum TaxID=134849 RepID=A0A1M7TXE4_9ACTN|nr:hypothetical protein [Cryptosporangium aurantiacum]SHN75376.1 hypothetical protein SAMN05443668_107282 [Cryptosporangium aurantiacum]
MSSPHTPDSSSPPPGYGPSRPPSVGRAPILAGLAGLLVGVFVVGIVWLGTALIGGGDDHEGAAADAAASCRILERIDATNSDSLDLPYAYRIGAAAQLAAAAAEDDRRYQVLSRDTHAASQAIQYADAATARNEIAQALATCEGL